MILINKPTRMFVECSCSRSERKQEWRHLGSPTHKTCWNILRAHRIFFKSRERETSVLSYFKVTLVLFKKEKVILALFKKDQVEI